MKLILAITFAILLSGCPDVGQPHPSLRPVRQPVVQRTYFYYRDFGAVGDGVTDDFDAIVRTHNAANFYGRNAVVRATPGATYLIGSTIKTAFIETDTDWTGAYFILDDSRILRKGPHWADSWVFWVRSTERPFQVHNVTSLRRNQERIFANLGRPMLWLVTDNTVRRYIREGHDVTNPGYIGRDVFITDRDGFVDPSAPILWDFHNITSLTAFPIDEWELTITGGHFTTIPGRGSCFGDGYKRRGIRIERSNTTVDGIRHEVIEYGFPTSPYYGFLHIAVSSNVTVKNSQFSGRFFNGGTGTYDLAVSDSVNTRFINCVQLNDITDPTYWGIFISNFAKNILFDGVYFSRFDAHMGVHNATILNSDLGYQGIQIIGSGTLRVENTTVRGTDLFLGLRSDYGSTWEGNMYFRNITLFPSNPANSRLIQSQNHGGWNFGYQCFMPRFVFIDNYRVMMHGENGWEQWTGRPVLFRAEYRQNYTPGDPPCEGFIPFPYIITEAVFMRNMNRGYALTFNDNSNMFLQTHVRTSTTEWPREDWWYSDDWPWPIKD